MDKIPVLVLAFNRPDHVKKSMRAIAQYQPERLYLACDGPRKNNIGEKEKVLATREAMLDAVDWPCEVKTLFRDTNLGCANAVNGAISWFFEHEEYGIICEDDIILGQGFFKLCEELLPRYASEERIMSISSQNHSMRKDINNTYVYSYWYDCWGWATWRRAWSKMDMTMSGMTKLTIWHIIQRYGVLSGLKMYYDFYNSYKNINLLSSWATRFYLSIIIADGLIIIPGANLAVNIGMDGGTHYSTSDKNPYSYLNINSVNLPLVYNDSLNVEKKQDGYERYDYLRVRMFGLKKKIKNILKNYFILYVFLYYRF